MSIVILDYRLPQYSFYPFNAFIHQSFDFRGCKSDSDHFPSCTCIHVSMVLCVYAYRNCLQNARFSLLYVIDAKYRFDITFPNSFRNIERPKNYRHNDFIYSLFYFLVVMVVGDTARQDYFTHFKPSQSLRRKREIPKINHLATRKQNLACPTCYPSYAWTHIGEMTSDLECLRWLAALFTRALLNFVLPIL